jgi:hypothetical protein
MRHRRVSVSYDAMATAQYNRFARELRLSLQGNIFFDVQ